MNCSNCGANLMSPTCEYCDTFHRGFKHSARAEIGNRDVRIAENGAAGAEPTRGDSNTEAVDRLRRKIEFLRQSPAPDDVKNKKIALVEKEIRKLTEQ